MTPLRDSDFFNLEVNYITHFRVPNNIFCEFKNILNFYILSCSKNNFLTEDISSYLQKNNISLDDVQRDYDAFMTGEVLTNDSYSQLRNLLNSNDIVLKEVSDLTNSVSRIKQNGASKDPLNPLCVERLDFNGKRILLASTHRTDIVACLLLGLSTVPVILA
jgi:hypothetical protein